MSSVYIVAVERSGDQIGADLVSALRGRDPSFEIYGTGGEALAKQDVCSNIDISDLAILGFVEAIKVYAIVLDRVIQVTDDILKKSPDAVILIDSWGFMIRVAKTLKSKGYTGKIIKYVAPQVWAMRAGRAKTLARYVDHLLTIHSFDAPYFERYALPVTYIGNPVFDTDYGVGDGEAFRLEVKAPTTCPIVTILFGSRLSEIQNLAKPFADAIERIKQHYPHVVFVSPMSSAIATDIASAAGQDLRLQDVIFLPETRKYDVFAATDVALACSGTVTTQLACLGIPSVVAYRLNPLTYFLAKRLYKPDYISIVNVAANRALMPEFVQADCTGSNLAKAVITYLDNQTLRITAGAALKQQTLAMKGEGENVSARAAKAVCDIIRVE